MSSRTGEAVALSPDRYTFKEFKKLAETLQLTIVLAPLIQGFQEGVVCR